MHRSYSYVKAETQRNSSVATGMLESMYSSGAVYLLLEPIFQIFKMLF